MYCIIDGAVVVTHVDKTNRKNEIRQIAAGSVIGERELLTGENRVATVTALTDLSALEVSKPALDNLLANAPDLLENFRATYEIRDAILRQIVPDRGLSLRQRLMRRIRKLVLRKP
jgi:CRP-like cAMP-binding protein